MSSWKGPRQVTRGWGSRGRSLECGTPGASPSLSAGLRCHGMWAEVFKRNVLVFWRTSIMTKARFDNSFHDVEERRLCAQVTYFLEDSKGSLCGEHPRPGGGGALGKSRGGRWFWAPQADWPQQGALQKEQWEWNFTAVIVNLMLPNSLTLWNRWSSGLAVRRANVNSSILSSSTPLIPSENRE